MIIDSHQEPVALPAAAAHNADSTALEVAAGHDLTGRVAIVTGATTGIGVETARALASTGATIVLGVRNVARGAEIARSIATSTGNDKIVVLELDLSSLRSVQSFSGKFLERFSALHILVNNAGIADAPFEVSEDGFELHFATNYLGHFLLFKRLADLLAAAGDGRVVSLTSAAHRRSAIDFEDIQFTVRKYDAYAAYAQSKTATSLFGVALTKRFLSSGISCNAVMPGMIITDLVSDWSPERLRMMRFADECGTLQPYVKSVGQGAATTVWAALAPELGGIGGRYLEDCTFAQPWSRELQTRHPWAGFVPHALAGDDADRLWEQSEDMIRCVY